jgi:methionyl-tRNA synthetase
MPETKDNDFTWSDFQKRNNNELVAILGNFVNRALVLTHKYFDGNVPPQNALTAFDNEIIAEIKQSVELLEHEISHYRFREALKAAMNVARIGNRYLADTEPWKLIKTDESRVQTILNIALQITANAAIVFEPFLPFSTKKIKHFLNINSINWELAGNMDILDTGHALNKPQLLFEKVEDEVIAKQREKLEQSSVQPKNVEPQKETVEFDDFTKLDIRAATIIEAEKVPKTKKLVKLKVDTGIDQRTVVAGIAEYYDTETLKGRRVSVLVNLAPRKLKGITSQGMILMAENQDGTLCFIAPGEDAENGAVVR